MRTKLVSKFDAVYVLSQQRHKNMTLKSIQDNTSTYCYELNLYKMEENRDYLRIKTANVCEKKSDKVRYILNTPGMYGYAQRSDHT